MVLRSKKKSKKYLGSRRWGRGNIKNGRGAGDRGGVGNGGKKHKFTWYTAKAPELIGRPKGFVNPKSNKLKTLTLEQINKIVINAKQESNELEFKDYKILSNGNINKSLIIKAAKFSKQAVEKIKSKGGQAIIIPK